MRGVGNIVCGHVPEASSRVTEGITSFKHACIILKVVITDIFESQKHGLGQLSNTPHFFCFFLCAQAAASGGDAARRRVPVSTP